MSNPSGSIHRIEFPCSVLKRIEDHARTCYPEEACGVLLGYDANGGLITVTEFLPIKNTADQPLHAFTLHPAEWTSVVLTRPDLVGLFHSHPHTPPEPSAKDLAELEAFGSLLRIYAIGTPFRVSDGFRLKLATYEVTMPDHSGSIGHLNDNAGPAAPSPAHCRAQRYHLQPVPYASLK
ncbi:M67 family metallopeptidase [Paenibacillus cisolokensis]|uniref:M67 family metallopeptidase n=1 Tax=Paenibacillus cisolokensis TaxID=1658519 RepID=UPI003D29EDBE